MADSHGRGSSGAPLNVPAGRGLIAGRGRGTGGPTPIAPQRQFLRIGERQLAEMCFSQRQRTILRMRGQDVQIFAGRVTTRQIESGRPSYINAMLIQSRGNLRLREPVMCRSCAQNPTRGPLTECRVLPNRFNNCCGNCKWRDQLQSCSHTSMLASDFTCWS